MVGSDVSEHVIQFKHVPGQILLQFAAKWEKKTEGNVVKELWIRVVDLSVFPSQIFWHNSWHNANYVYLRRRRDVDEEI